MKTKIYLGKVYTSMVQENAGVFYGDNNMEGWKSSSKTNYAIGRINGDGNFISSRLNLIHDPDIFDMLTKTQCTGR